MSYQVNICVSSSGKWIFINKISISILDIKSMFDRRELKLKALYFYVTFSLIFI